MQLLRVFEQLFVKIEHMAVRIAFAQDGDETKVIHLHAKTFAVGLNQPLSGQLRGTVERSLNRKRASLRGGENLGFSIDRAS